MRLSLVAAVARGGVIGRAGSLPWRIPEDAQRFRSLTMGHPVVMGRKTWDSLPDRFRPLPGRRNVVVSRNADWHADGAERTGSLTEALELLEGTEQVFVIGGAELYASALPLADELLLTEIDADVAGDSFFPGWDRDAFGEASRESHVSEQGIPFSFVSYTRRTNGLDGVQSKQLAAIAAVDALLEGAGISYWLFGGWAVDFHAGSITRPHSDVDIAIWLEDFSRISELLEGGGWRHSSSPVDDGGTGFEREAVRLELTYLARDDLGRVVTPIRDGPASWPEGAFQGDVRSLHGVRAHVIALAALTRGKSSPREDLGDAAKDRADFDVLSDLQL